MKTKAILKGYSSGIWLSLAFSFLLMVYAPLELFFGNVGEFWFDFQIMLPVIAELFLIMWLLFGIILLVSKIINDKFYKFLLTAEMVAFIGCYVQGNFFISNLPHLDGTNVEWSAYGSENIKTIIVWVIAAVVVAILWGKTKEETFYKIIGGAGICLFLFLGITIFTLGLTTDGTRSKGELGLLTTTDKDIMEMSTDTNFIILLMDTVDSQILRAEMDNDSEFIEAMDGFTFFENTLSAYPFTRNAIPQLLTGIWYENETDFYDYQEEAFNNAELFRNLKEEKYKMTLYDDIMLRAGGRGDDFENIECWEREVSSYKDLAKCIVKMAGIKYAPYFLKERCYDVPVYSMSIRAEHDESQIYTFMYSLLWFNEDLKEEMSYTSEKCFKFIHLEGAHVPFKYDADLNYYTEGATYEGNVQATMTVIKRYLQKLKQSNVYDNSVIIVLSDHGYNFDYVVERQHTMLFVKGIDERHDMKIDSAPISFDDLQEGYKLLLQGKGSDEVFPYEENTQRERRFLYYVYGEEENLVEYVQTGYAGDEETLIPTGREFNLAD